MDSALAEVCVQPGGDGGGGDGASCALSWWHLPRSWLWALLLRLEAACTSNCLNQRSLYLRDLFCVMS